jgi:hypothetical protein
VISTLKTILFASLLLALGCSRPDKDRSEILQTLTTRANALNSRNISSYISIVSPQYNDKGKDFIQLKESLEKNFRDLEQLSYMADTPSITIDGNHAESVGSYRMKVRVRGKELALNGTERFRMAKEPGGWKIIAGI